MKSRFLSCMSALALWAAATSASAGYVIQANVVKIRATEYNAYFVFVDTNILDRAACSVSSSENAFAIDPSTPGGKAQLKAVMAAQLAKLKVTIAGRGHPPTTFVGNTQCHLWNAIESVNYVDVHTN